MQALVSIDTKTHHHHQYDDHHPSTSPSCRSVSRGLALNDYPPSARRHPPNFQRHPQPLTVAQSFKYRAMFPNGFYAGGRGNGHDNNNNNVVEEEQSLPPLLVMPSSLAEKYIYLNSNLYI
eukprot:PhM_4_TR7100/c0_g1_i1/m.102929